jgi:hypothetical protein
MAFSTFRCIYRECVLANKRALPTGGSDRGKNIDKRNTEKGEHKADAKKGRLPEDREWLAKGVYPRLS